MIFVSEVPGDGRVPTEADIAFPESGGPERMVQAMKQGLNLNKDISFEQPGVSKIRGGGIR